MSYMGDVTGTVDVMDRNPLARELETFEAHRAELLGTAAGKFALVHEASILGTYDTERDAINEGYRQFGNVPFLVRQVAPEERPLNFVNGLVKL